MSAIFAGAIHGYEVVALRTTPLTLGSVMGLRQSAPASTKWFAAEAMTVTDAADAFFLGNSADDIHR